MRKADLLYFAGGIRFEDVDLCGPKLPEQFGQRIEEFYIKPAIECERQCYAFAAGVLLVSCIDALARIRFGRLAENRFQEAARSSRFENFAREELSSFSRNDLAKNFYQDFRNGLVHQAELKNGAQFSFDITATVDDSEGPLVVNPRFLACEVSVSLQKYVALLKSDQLERKKLATALKQDLDKDFRFAQR